jgi:16S rRNA (adenine1518-N6/adenine1519-N6)-dimethyltransferase
MARKALGQHFLLDFNIISRIVAAAAPLDDLHVIEIGPGPGGLTRALLASRAASVTAIEIDRRAIAALAELHERAGPRLSLIEGDAKTVDYLALTPAPRAIIANLPYNVGTPLLIAWLRNAAAFTRLVLMFQREVAERICAAPASAAYGRLAVLAQSVSHAECVFRLPPSAFTPPPAVESAVVRLVPRAEAPPPPVLAALERITAAAFGQRRKMLRRSLAPLGGDALLAMAQIDPARRAETLSIAEFLELAKALLARGE